MRSSQRSPEKLKLEKSWLLLAESRFTSHCTIVFCHSNNLEVKKKFMNCKDICFNNLQSARNCVIDPRGRPQFRPVMITIFTKSVHQSARTDVHPSQNFKSPPAGTVGWQSWSLMTPVLFFIYFQYILWWSWPCISITIWTSSPCQIWQITISLWFGFCS